MGSFLFHAIVLLQLCLCLICLPDKPVPNKYFAANSWTKAGQIYDTERCGLPLNVPKHAEGRWGEHKVMGGTGVPQGEQPWAVAIHKRTAKGEIYVCTGTLVSKRHVVTAAHCFVKPGTLWESTDADACQAQQCCTSAANDAIGADVLGKQMLVYIGSVCLDKSLTNKVGECQSERQPRKFTIRRADYTKFFDVLCQHDDFALMELDEEVPADLANHICLPLLHSSLPSGALKSVSPVTQFGWGVEPIVHCTDDPNNCPAMAQLQQLTIHGGGIWAEEKCGAHLPEYNKPSFEEKKSDAICTEARTTESACTGDSGGGLTGMFQVKATQNGNGTLTAAADEGNGNGTWRNFLLGVLTGGSDCHQLMTGSLQPEAQIQYYSNVSAHQPLISDWMEHPSSPSRKIDEMNASVGTMDDGNDSSGGGGGNGEKRQSLWLFTIMSLCAIVFLPLI